MDIIYVVWGKKDPLKCWQFFFTHNLCSSLNNSLFCYQETGKIRVRDLFLRLSYYNIFTIFVGLTPSWHHGLLSNRVDRMTTSPCFSRLKL